MAELSHFQTKQQTSRPVETREAGFGAGGERGGTRGRTGNRGAESTLAVADANIMPVCMGRTFNGVDG